jgi:hypothetical protein
MKIIQRVVLLIVAVVLTLCASRDAGALTATLCGPTDWFNAGCPSSGPTITIGNGAMQNPEIILVFWQDAGPQQWTNPKSGQYPTTGQVIAAALSITASSYFPGLEEYGVSAPARVSPMVGVQTGAPSGSTVGPSGQYAPSDIANVIKAQIAGGAIPPPQPYENMIYVVFTPNDANGGGNNYINGPYDGCTKYPSFCYNNVPFSGVLVRGWTKDNTSISRVFSHEVVEAITAWNGVSLSGCKPDINVSQIADLSSCRYERQSSFSVQAYWSVKQHACVIPESWGDLYVNKNGAWTSPPASFPMRQASGGGQGIVATSTYDDFNGNTAYFFDGSKWLGHCNYTNIDGFEVCTEWVADSIGNNAVVYAAGGVGNDGIIAGLTWDTSQMAYYSVSSGNWTFVNPPSGVAAMTSITVTWDGVIVVTDTHGNPITTCR